MVPKNAGSTNREGNTTVERARGGPFRESWTTPSPFPSVEYFENRDEISVATKREAVSIRAGVLSLERKRFVRDPLSFQIGLAALGEPVLARKVWDTGEGDLWVDEAYGLGFPMLDNAVHELARVRACPFYYGENPFTEVLLVFRGVPMLQLKWITVQDRRWIMRVWR